MYYFVLQIIQTYYEKKKSSVKKNHEIIWTISITVKGPKDLQNIYPLTCYWSLFLRSNKFGDQNAN